MAGRLGPPVKFLSVAIGEFAGFVEGLASTRGRHGHSHSSCSYRCPSS
jgi:hypothetical protein